MDLETSLDRIKQIFDPITLIPESPLILKFLLNSIKGLKDPQYIKSHDLLLEKIDANDPEHDSRQNPVLLVPGYFENPKIYYNLLDNLREHEIKHAYWVEGYPFKSIKENSDILSGIIDDILNKLKIEKCSLIGHSLGGPIVFKTAMEFPDKINKCIALGSPFNGTEAADKAYEILNKFLGESGIKSLEDRGYSLAPLREMFSGNDILKGLKLNEDVDYYSIFSENDYIVLPWHSSVINGANNINVNKHLGLNNIGHIRMVYKKRIREVVSEILDNSIDKERFIN